MEKNKSGYLQSIEEIAAIITKIESGETDLDLLPAELKRAADLLQECRERLFKTEQEVAKIIKPEE